MIVLRAIVIGYLVVCALLWAMQDSLLFFPNTDTEAELQAQAREEGFEPWTNLRGEHIGWKSSNGAAPNALLVCHGNGGYALGHNYRMLRTSNDGNFQIFLLEYPGYGARPGKISTQTLTDAAVDAIDTLAADPHRRIWLLGQSLGSGIACAAAAMRPDRLAGIVLVTPFDSLAAAAATHYPWLPVRLLLRHHLDSDKNLTHFHGPVAFVVGGRDGSIPPRHGKRLYEGYAGPKRLWLVPEARHNDFRLLLTDWPQIFGWLQATPKN